jgi:hypothetical protein
MPTHLPVLNITATAAKPHMSATLLLQCTVNINTQHTTNNEQVATQAVLQQRC